MSGLRRQFQALVSSEAWVRIPLQSCICFCFFFFSQQPDDSAAVQPEASTRRCTLRVGWPSGPRRQFKARISPEAWVRIPLQSCICFFFSFFPNSPTTLRPCNQKRRPGGALSGLDGRAVQGASLRHWSLRRRGFESHSNHTSPLV